MNQIPIEKLYISKKYVHSIDKIQHSEKIGYKLFLKEGFNDGEEGTIIYAKTIVDLKKKLRNVQIGLTKNQIKKLKQRTEWEQEINNFFDIFEIEANQFIAVTLKTTLDKIDKESEYIWNTKLKQEYDEYVHSGKPVYAYRGVTSYIEYKYAYRNESGVKQSDIALYEMREKDRRSSINNLKKVNYRKAKSVIQLQGGEILNIKYAWVTKDKMLKGMFECAKGTVAFSAEIKIRNSFGLIYSATLVDRKTGRE